MMKVVALSDRKKTKDTESFSWEALTFSDKVKKSLDFRGI